MKTFAKLLCLALACVFALSALAACGDGDKPTAKIIDIRLTDEDYAFGVDKDQPELLEQVNAFIAEIMENGTFEEICNKYFGDGTPTAVASAELDPNKDQLLVATNAAFEPFEYKDGDMYYGIDMEIAKLLADKLGKELVIQNMDFDAVCLSVGQHQSDIAMAGLTINETREQYVTFATPYYKASQKLIVPSNDTRFDDCKTVEDIEAILKEMDKNTKIGVQNGTTGQKYLVGDADWGFEGFNVDCIGYKNGSLAVQDMLNGNLDYVVIDEEPAKFITEAINKNA
ncbi:MAG TPA: transporter substrate-binding domain-containing protein [Firmicutes bacterium]|nr:transporter substrate-binding domain-containing protein [Bacillota bacterium]